MPETATDKQALIEDRLSHTGDLTLDAIVLKNRKHGVGWNAIAELVADTAGVSITGESLRQWFPQYNRPGIELADLTTS